MSTEPKNLHVSEALLIKLDALARNQSVSREQLVQDILAAAVERPNVDNIFSSMQAHAQSLGLTVDDVEPAIAAYRRTHPTHR